MHILLLHIFCHIKKPRKKRARQKREIIKKGGNGWNKTGKRIKTSDIIFKFLEITAFFLPFKIGGPQYKSIEVPLIKRHQNNVQVAIYLSVCLTMYSRSGQGQGLTFLEPSVPFLLCPKHNNFRDRNLNMKSKINVFCPPGNGRRFLGELMGPKPGNRGM